MKRLVYFLFLGVLLISLSGCIKRDSYEGITIYTTVYPVDFITKYLYGEHANIHSIYPNGIDIETYTITNKKMNDFSKGDLFVYNGLSNEKDIAANLLNKNRKMDIIDVSLGLEIKNDLTELWLSPSNFLMMTSNIKNGLKDKISHTGILDEIDLKYSNLKVAVSEFDADLKLIAENCSNKKIIVANDTFMFLEKYGFEVISVSGTSENSNTNISRAESYYSSKENTYLFELAGTEENDTIKSLVKAGAKKVDISTMITLTEEQSKNDYDYFYIMNTFIDAIKSEVY